MAAVDTERDLTVLMPSKSFDQGILYTRIPKLIDECVMKAVYSGYAVCSGCWCIVFPSMTTANEQFLKHLGDGLSRHP